MGGTGRLVIRVALRMVGRLLSAPLLRAVSENIILYLWRVVGAPTGPLFRRSLGRTRYRIGLNLTVPSPRPY